MTQGRSIRLFLVDGTARGLLTAEIVNWTGHVLTGPRSRLGDVVQRPEAARTGVYFLVGPDPESPIKPLVYIGETDNVAARLRNHNRPETNGGAGGRDFWERVIIVTSKDQNLTKAHVGFLENRLLTIAREVDRCSLANGNEGRDTRLPEADRSDMGFFVEQIRTVLPVLGYDFLRDQRPPPSEPESMPQAAESPEFRFEVPRHDLAARGQEIDGEFYVLKGSTARSDWKGAEGGYEPLFRQLVADGVLTKTGEGNRRFTRDTAFSSPSAAAAVVAGRSANGRMSWQVAETGQTYGAWQDAQVSATQPTDNTD